MSIKAKPTVQDILERFNAAMKTAEEAPKLQDDNLPSEPEVDDKAAEVGKEEAAPAAADDVAELNKNKDRGEDAGQVLGAIAKEAAEAHYDALKKEAAVFGEIFAKAAVEQMNKLAAERDAALQKEAADHEEAELARQCKLAADEAYANTLAALQAATAEAAPAPAEPAPAEAAPVATEPAAEPAPEATLGDAATAVTTAADAALEAAKAATALTKAIQEQAAAPVEAEPSAPAEEQAIDPEAVQQAYDNTMAYLDQPAPGAAQQPDEVAQQAYANTMAAMQG